jgi:hypothetical protein
MPEETYTVVSRTTAFCNFIAIHHVEDIFSAELKGLKGEAP